MVYLNKYNYLGTSFNLEKMIMNLTDNFMLNITVHTAAVAGLIPLMIFTYKKNRLEKLGSFIMFPHIKILYHVSISYLFGVIIFKPLFTFSYDSALANLVLDSIILLLGLFSGFFIAIIISILVDQKRISAAAIFKDRTHFISLILVTAVFIILTAVNLRT